MIKHTAAGATTGTTAETTTSATADMAAPNAHKCARRLNINAVTVSAAALSAAALCLAACSGGGGGGSPSPTSASTPTPTPTVSPTPTPTPTPTPSPTATPTSSGNQPNILLIISDDQGLDSAAQYSVSTDLPTTPVLDGLADNGLVFETMWVAPVCTPTRGAMITGKYSLRTNVLAVGDELPASEQVLHAYLAADPNTQNYATALIGKWHLGGNRAAADHPNSFGVPHYAGMLSGGVQDYYNWSLVENGTTTTQTTYATTKLTDLAIDWTTAQTSPWFLWLAYNAPHDPYHLPPQNLHTRTLSGDQADIDANPAPYYLAAIEAMDSEIGRLLDSLPAQVRADTIVIFVGDNGTPRNVRDENAYPGGTKGTLTEGGLRVPLIVSGAGVTRPNAREDALVNHTDVFATIADLAGSTAGNVHDSQSFADILSDANAPEREFIYSEAVNNNNANNTGWAIRNAQYKLIEYADGSQELYDVLADPTEQNNLLASNPASVSDVRDQLLAAATQIRQ